MAEGFVVKREARSEKGTAGFRKTSRCRFFRLNLLRRIRQPNGGVFIVPRFVTLRYVPRDNFQHPSRIHFAGLLRMTRTLCFQGGSIEVLFETLKLYNF